MGFEREKVRKKSFWFVFMRENDKRKKKKEKKLMKVKENLTIRLKSILIKYLVELNILF